MKYFNTLISDLKDELQSELPGLEAQLLMAPNIRIDELRSKYESKSAKNSSVLILLYPNNKSIYIVFIKRNHYDGVHSGQISFPGGQQEKTDKNLVETALREAQEEINVEKEKVHILGNLTPIYIPPSNYNVLPVVGYSKIKPDFFADVKEVNQIIEVNIREILNNANINTGPVWSSGKVTISAPFYAVSDVQIWGATAMIASEFVEVIKKIKSGNTDLTCLLG